MLICIPKDSFKWYLGFKLNIKAKKFKVKLIFDFVIIPIKTGLFFFKFAYFSFIMLSNRVGLMAQRDRIIALRFKI